MSQDIVSIHERQAAHIAHLEAEAADLSRRLAAATDHVERLRRVIAMLEARGDRMSPYIAAPRSR